MHRILLKIPTEPLLVSSIERRQDTNDCSAGTCLYYSSIQGCGLTLGDILMPWQIRFITCLCFYARDLFAAMFSLSFFRKKPLKEAANLDVKSK